MSSPKNPEFWSKSFYPHPNNYSDCRLDGLPTILPDPASPSFSCTSEDSVTTIPNSPRRVPASLGNSSTQPPREAGKDGKEKEDDKTGLALSKVESKLNIGYINLAPTNKS